MWDEYSLILELCKFAHPNKEKIKELLDRKPDMPMVLGNLLFQGVFYFQRKVWF